MLCKWHRLYFFLSSEVCYQQDHQLTRWKTHSCPVWEVCFISLDVFIWPLTGFWSRWQQQYSFVKIESHKSSFTHQLYSLNHIHLCRFPSVQLFAVDSGTEECLSRAETLALPHAPWDMTFDSQNQLWVLLETEDVNVLLYRYSEQHWKVHTCGHVAFFPCFEVSSALTNSCCLFIAVWLGDSWTEEGHWSITSSVGSL